MNIKEALSREVGENVIKISGLVTKAGKRTESDHPEYGHTSFQPITIKDDSGEIGCTLGNQLEIKQGVSITIEAHKSDKHGFTGIKVEEYKDKKQLKVSKSAIITVEGTDMSNKPESTVKQPIPAQKQASVSTYSTPFVDWNEKRYIAEIEKQGLIIKQSCQKVAVDILKTWKSDESFSLEQLTDKVLKISHVLESDIMDKVNRTNAGVDVKKDDEEIPF